MLLDVPNSVRAAGRAFDRIGIVLRRTGAVAAVGGFADARPPFIASKPRQKFRYRSEVAMLGGPWLSVSLPRARARCSRPTAMPMPAHVTTEDHARRLEH